MRSLIILGIGLFFLWAKPCVAQTYGDSLQPPNISNRYGGSFHQFGPWIGAVGSMNHPGIEGGIFYQNFITGCTGWMTKGVALGAEYLPRDNAWGTKALVWFNPFHLNVGLASEMYWLDGATQFNVRPQIGIRLVYASLDYGYALRPKTENPVSSLHTLTLHVMLPAIGGRLL